MSDFQNVIPAGERLRVLGGAALRTLLGIVFLLVILSLIPGRLQASLWAFLFVLVVVVVIYVLHFRSQLRGIRRAKYPGVRATEALVLTAALFLTEFASLYVFVQGENAESFNASMTSWTALYFTVTVFATVGFGDIVATTDFARGLVTLQMVLGLGFVVVVAKVYTGYVQYIREQRRGQPTSD